MGKMACVAECIAKKFNVVRKIESKEFFDCLIYSNLQKYANKIHCIIQVDNNGNVKENEFRKMVKSDLAKADYEKAMSDATVTKCIQKASASSMIPNKVGNCGLIPTKAAICVVKEFMTGCPANMQDKSDKCEKMRKIFTMIPMK